MENHQQKINEAAKEAKKLIAFGMDSQDAISVVLGNHNIQDENSLRGIVKLINQK